MRSLAVFLALVALTSPASANRPIIGVTSESTEYGSAARVVEQYLPLRQYLSKAVGTEFQVVFSQDLTRDLQRTRTGDYAIIIAPAHLIGSALRYGYEPIAGLPARDSAVFVSLKGSGIATLDRAAGKRLGLPHDDSLATYLALGELNAKNLAVKKHFQSVHNTRYHESALEGLELGIYDVVATDARFAKTWLQKHPGHVVFESRAVPAMSIAVNSRLGREAVASVKRALLAPDPKTAARVQIADVELSMLQRTAADDYTYVSTLGYFTPTLLPGAKVVSAEEVLALMSKGATFLDVRTSEEFNQRRVKGAKLLPYRETSKKEVDFDSGKDEFKLAEAVPDRATHLVFACNGAECWKSYKASHFALKAGYRNVYWFRGGFPEWRAKELPLEP